MLWMRTFRQVGREKKGTFHELGLKSTKQKSKIAKKKLQETQGELMTRKRLKTRETQLNRIRVKGKHPLKHTGADKQIEHR